MTFPSFMFLAMVLMTIATIFPLVIIGATLVLSLRSPINVEKMTPFECGFDPVSSARTPFSLRFFILAVIFLVFDIEIALLMPVPVSMIFFPSFLWFITSFCMILLIGLYQEWNEGSLDWT
uniref:NADH-ubiquinone oxidoreductase chain 3 n=1 Tax=Paraleonnates uschakovi TaxID=1922336 RepID=A0A343A8S0_9ANNE|nr:NADH dehydrogenase subunit 3 [Paraleonnates uschakovi]APG32420.1 NADH dehydrogenase subunit 3 [Paraleonnates uschakovi]